MQYKSQFDRIYPILLNNWYVLITKIAIFIGFYLINTNIFFSHPILYQKKETLHATSLS